MNEISFTSYDVSNISVAKHAFMPTSWPIKCLLSFHGRRVGEVGFATYKSGSLQALSSNVIKSNKYEDVYGGHSASIMFGYGYILR